jgi:hypothetical protein
MSLHGLHGPIEWPGPAEVPDLRRRPLAVAIAALHATTRAVIHGVVSVHPKLAPGRDDAARAIVTIAEQLLAVLELYLSPAPTPAPPPPHPAAASHPVQLRLPFPATCISVTA